MQYGCCFHSPSKTERDEPDALGAPARRSLHESSERERTAVVEHLGLRYRDQARARAGADRSTGGRHVAEHGPARGHLMSPLADADHEIKAVRRKRALQQVEVAC